MAVVSESEANSYLTRLQTCPGCGLIAVSCVNSPINMTFTGDDKAIETLKIILEEDKVYVCNLDVDVAYHLAHMKQIAAKYLELIQNLEPPEQSKSNQEAAHIFFSKRFNGLSRSAGFKGILDTEPRIKSEFLLDWLTVRGR